MESKIESLRRKYKDFRRGKEDVLAVRHEAMLVLEEARRNGYSEVTDEVEDMLIDLEFSIEENKCKCHRKNPNC